MAENYKSGDWVSVYQSALTELEDAKMSGRIEAAQTAILARIEKLRALPDLHAEERQAIEDAMRGLPLFGARGSTAQRATQTPCGRGVIGKTALHRPYHRATKKRVPDAD